MFTYPVPKVGKEYTYEQMLTLKLGDSPHLGAVIKGPTGQMTQVVIQDSHCTEKQLASVLKDALFTYKRTTHESIPVFMFSGTEEEFLKLVDIELLIDPHFSDVHTVATWYVTPKGFPAEQYHKFNEDFTKIVSAGSFEYDVPHWLNEVRKHLAK